MRVSKVSNLRVCGCIYSTPELCNYNTINLQYICQSHQSTRKPHVSLNPCGSISLVNQGGKKGN